MNMLLILIKRANLRQLFL